MPLLRQYHHHLRELKRAAYASCALSASSSVVESAGVAGGLYLLGAGRIGEGLASFSGCLAISAVLFYFGETGRARCLVRLDTRHRGEVLDAVLRVSWRRWTELKLGGVAQGLMADTWALQEATAAYLETIAQLGSAAAFTVGAVALSPSAVALGALCGLLIWPAHRALTRARAGRGAPIPRLFDETTVTAMELFAQFKLVRSTASERPFVRRIARLTRQANDRLYAARALGAQTRMLALIGGAVFATLLGVVWFYVARDSFARFVAFLILFSRLGTKLVHVARGWTTASEFAVFLEKRERLIAALATGVETPRGTRAAPVGEIAFRDVAIELDGVPVLRGVNVTIEKNAVVVVRGASGAGKTTLVDLLTGLLTPDRGQITVAGIPLVDIAPAAWNARLGLVLQDSPLLHDTVLANVAWERAPDEVLARRALSAAGLGELDLASIVGQQGLKLSGGQRQRMGLARALYREAELLVLDEPTASLDARTEGEILDMLARLRGTRTILLVSHREAAMRIADEIWTVENGTIKIARSSPGTPSRDAGSEAPNDTLPL